VDTLEKLKILGAAAKYDVCAASGCGSGSLTSATAPVRSAVCHSFLPDGRCISLFKVLQTNECLKDCAYCPNRAQQDSPRTGFAPQELAALFMEFYRRNYVAGLFLSSGISRSPSQTMEQIIKTAEILRFRFKYNGYIHLKVLPGAGYEYVEQAVRLASRVSVNIEAPSSGRLQKLSRTKNFNEDIIGRMKWINSIKREGVLPAGQTTQFIVGAAGESDSEIIKTTVGLYGETGLRRVYFSAFQPVTGTPLEGLDPVPVFREHRLYQADFLLRQYGFRYDELYFNNDGNLPSDRDPKMSYAINNLHLFPIEINRASYSQLLRVPGIGPVSAGRIVRARKEFRITRLEELKNIGVVVKKAAPFVQVNGRFNASHKLVQQLELWSENRDHSAQGNPFLTS